MTPEYIVVAYGPDDTPMGDYIARGPEEAIDYAQHYLGEERRDGARVTINVVATDDQQDEQDN